MLSQKQRLLPDVVLPLSKKVNKNESWRCRKLAESVESHSIVEDRQIEQKKELRSSRLSLYVVEDDVLLSRVEQDQNCISNEQVTITVKTVEENVKNNEEILLCKLLPEKSKSKSIEDVSASEDNTVQAEHVQNMNVHNEADDIHNKQCHVIQEQLSNAIRTEPDNVRPENREISQKNNENQAFIADHGSLLDHNQDFDPPIGTFTEEIAYNENTCENISVPEVTSSDSHCKEDTSVKIIFKKDTLSQIISEEEKYINLGQDPKIKKTISIFKDNEETETSTDEVMSPRKFAIQEEVSLQFKDEPKTKLMLESDFKSTEKLVKWKIEVEGPSKKYIEDAEEDTEDIVDKKGADSKGNKVIDYFYVLLG
jgi:hypothetical protein